MIHPWRIRSERSSIWIEKNSLRNKNTVLMISFTVTEFGLPLENVQ